MRNKVEVFTLDRDSLKLGLGLSQLFYHNSSKAECGMAIRTHLILLLLRAVPRSLGWLDAFFLVVYASDVSFLVLLLWSVFRCVCCSVSSLEVLISTVLSGPFTVSHTGTSLAWSLSPRGCYTWYTAFLVWDITAKSVGIRHKRS